MRIYKTLSIDYACLVTFILFHIYIYILFRREINMCRSLEKL
jgi:hypothetical protein